jgi:hypothetical protein
MYGICLEQALYKLKTLFPGLSMINRQNWSYLLQHLPCCFLRRHDWAEFEPTNSAGERPQTHVLDRAATETDTQKTYRSSSLCTQFLYSLKMDLWGPKQVALSDFFYNNIVTNKSSAFVGLNCGKYFFLYYLYRACYMFRLIIPG